MDSKIKIAFFDVDGTLASNTIQSDNTFERISESTKRALELLKENGIIPVVATGRGRLFVQPLINDLQMDSFIASNGLSVTYQNVEIFHNFLAVSQLHDIMNQLDKVNDIMISLETTKGNVFVDETFSRSELDRYTNVYQIIVVGKDIKDRVQLNVEEIKGIMVAPRVMNILPTHISKAKGIEKMLEILHLTKEQAIAFGDEENDLEMFKAVKTSVAMGNGVAALKQIATYITTSVDEDGVYLACKHFGLI